MPLAADYHPLRAPRGHGEGLVEPAWEHVGSLLACNQERRSQAGDYPLQGQTLAELSRQARSELVAAAQAYTAAYREVPAAGAGQAILLAGHQAQLFHGGVWFKNFALSSLAAEHQAWAINVLIDNDIHRMPSIRVPTGSSAERHITAMQFDRTAEAIPYEERPILDRALFESFGSRVEQTLDGLVERPVIRQLWPLAIHASRRSENLGRCLAEARHRLEGQWGARTLELPLSRICQSPCFARFAVHLLADLPRFQQIYNLSLGEYRRSNRIRSRSHPVPDLAADGVWLEAPFWIWTVSAPHRQRLFVRRRGDRLEVTDRRQVQFDLPLSADADAGPAVEQWVAQQEAGIKLRPRALMTTMYARLVLCDLFLHGIGGGKYDQLSDLIIERFFALRPPHYLILSATALLFPDRTGELRRQIRETRQLSRELQFHPEIHVRPSDEADRLAAQKRACLEQPPPAGERRQRHRTIVRINRELQQHLPVTPQQQAQRLQSLAADLRHESQFASREFSFCLFPDHDLRQLLRRLARIDS